MLLCEHATDFLDSNASGQDVFARIVLDVVGVDETEEVSMSFIIVCYHSVDD